MSAPAWPDHLVTLAEFEQLPEYERYVVEVQEGVLRVSPRPATLHQRVIKVLLGQLDSQLTPSLEALPELEVMIEERPLTVRIPDVIVVDTAYADTNPARAVATQVRLAIEVLSEGTVRADRVTKFAEYAEVGIAQYWIVDPTPPRSIEAFALVDGSYVRDGEYSGIAELRVGTTSVRLDLDGLGAR